MSRLLHRPTERLRALHDERGHAALETVRDLFGLEQESTAERPAGEPAAVTELHSRRSSQPGPR
jgi:hypothetical protein